LVERVVRNDEAVGSIPISSTISRQPPRIRKSSLDEMVFKIKADFLKALAHPVRLEIIEYLKDKEANVGKIMQALGISQSNLSRHLAILREMGILYAKQEKTTVYYGIQDHEIFRVLRPIAEILRKRLRKSEKLLQQLGRE
jgi:DNA-binding transcriptional ArsR family regulator